MNKRPRKRPLTFVLGRLERSPQRQGDGRLGVARGDAVDGRRARARYPRGAGGVGGSPASSWPPYVGRRVGRQRRPAVRVLQLKLERERFAAMNSGPRSRALSSAPGNSWGADWIIFRFTRALFARER